MKLCIVGCERSGTSAVAGLLSKASGWSLLDDPPEAWYTYPIVRMTGQGMSFRLWRMLRKHRIVKVPGFATILPYLRRRWLGDFATIYCVRDPRDVAASVKERLKKSHTGLFTEVGWLNLVCATPTEALAWRWRKYLEAAERYRDTRGKIVFVKYEDFCADRMAVLTDLAHRLSIPFDAERIGSDLTRQYKKSWDTRIAGPERWRRDLEPDEVRCIEEICAEAMERWDYA